MQRRLLLSIGVVAGAYTLEAAALVQSQAEILTARASAPASSGDGVETVRPAPPRQDPPGFNDLIGNLAALFIGQQAHAAASGSAAPAAPISSAAQPLAPAQFGTVSEARRTETTAGALLVAKLSTTKAFKELAVRTCAGAGAELRESSEDGAPFTPSSPCEKQAAEVALCSLLQSYSPIMIVETNCRGSRSVGAPVVRGGYDWSRVAGFMVKDAEAYLQRREIRPPTASAAAPTATLAATRSVPAHQPPPQQPPAPLALNAAAAARTQTGETVSTSSVGELLLGKVWVSPALRQVVESSCQGRAPLCKKYVTEATICDLLKSYMSQGVAATNCEGLRSLGAPELEHNADWGALADSLIHDLQAYIVNSNSSKSPSAEGVSSVVASPLTLAAKLVTKGEVPVKAVGLSVDRQEFTKKAAEDLSLASAGGAGLHAGEELIAKVIMSSAFKKVVDLVCPAKAESVARAHYDDVSLFIPRTRCQRGAAEKLWCEALNLHSTSLAASAQCGTKGQRAPSLAPGTDVGALASFVIREVDNMARAFEEDPAIAAAF